MRQNLKEAGRILDAARGSMSKREAARRSGIAEARWRQITTGVQRVSGVEVPVSTRPETLRRMAEAVGADPAEVLAAAGFDDVPEPPAPAPKSIEAAVERLDQIRDELSEIIGTISQERGRDSGPRYGQ